MKYVLRRYHIDPRIQTRSPAYRGHKTLGTTPLADERLAQTGQGHPGRPIFYRFDPGSLWRVASTAPFIGIQATQRSNWYSKQVNQTLFY